MYYLVDPLTKKHTAESELATTLLMIPGCANVVQADDDGWIPLVRKKRPVPQNLRIDVRMASGSIYWDMIAGDVINHKWESITHYRIPEDVPRTSKPKVVEGQPYAVDPETKEHRLLETMVIDGVAYYAGERPGERIVEADKNGWIPLVRKECPVPAGQDVSVMLLRQANRIYYACASRVPDWSLVTHYCISAEQKPEAVETDARPAPLINGQYEYVKIGSAEQKWWKVTIIAYDEGAPVGRTQAGKYRRLPLSEFRFRSPRTNRERWCERANEAWMKNTERRSTFEVIYDALLTGELEAPKPEDT